MPSQPAATWDLRGPVVDLLNNLEHHGGKGTPLVLQSDKTTVRDAAAMTDSNGKDKVSHGLGDFTKIWQYLGVSHDVPPPTVPPPKDLSDDSTECKDRPTNDVKDHVVSEETAGLTKKQKKKLRRKLKKAEALEAGQTTGESDGPVTPVKIPDLDEYPKNVSIVPMGSGLTQDAVAQPNPEAQAPRYNLRSLARASAPTEPDATPTPIRAAPPIILQRKQKQSSLQKLERAALPNLAFPQRGAGLQTVINASTPQPVPTFTSYSTSMSTMNNPLGTNLVPSQVYVPKKAPGRTFVPQTRQPQPQATPATPALSTSFSPNSMFTTPLMYAEQQLLIQQQTSLQPVPTPTQNPMRPMPPPVNLGRRMLNVRPGTERHELLFTKLLRDFPEDRSWLFAPMQLSANQTISHGIHVFVDASNILIGFNETLKSLQGMHRKTRMPGLDISFDSLVLLMERRRPAAKRVLVGSNPLLPAFDTARAVGYEVNILEKVQKERELSDHKKFLRDADRIGWKRAMAMRQSNGSGDIASPEMGGYGAVNSTSMTPSSSKLRPAPFVEQCVDELLHMKILESIVDVEHPSTLVLATGDAAEAEYSGGFLAQVERALKKGWKLELVSWKKSISGAYRKREFQEQWRNQFRIIELDEYAEELLNTQ